MVELACGLKKRGHEVEMFLYFPQYNFFRARVENAQIQIHEFNKGPGFSFGALRKLCSLMKNGKYDVILSYGGSPNIYAELAKNLTGGPKLIVSERSSHLNDKSNLSALMRRIMHIMADNVVVNSISHQRWLLKNYCWIRGKVHCIYNGYDLSSCDSAISQKKFYKGLNLLVIGRVGPEKNAINLINAIDIFNQRYNFLPSISWVGKRDIRPNGRRYCSEVDKLLESKQEIANRWHWLDEREDVYGLLCNSDALIHPSFYEGLPNVVCEAFISGTPVLISNVCDHPILVKEGERGFLFDPCNPEDIADAIAKFFMLTFEERETLSRNARSYAEDNLTIDRMVQDYECLFEKSH